MLLQTPPFAPTTLAALQQLGIADQAALRQTGADKAFLFKQVEKPKPYDPVAGTDPAVNNPFAKDTWNMTEQGKMLRENPEQAARLKAAANGK